MIMGNVLVLGMLSPKFEFYDLLRPFSYLASHVIFTLTLGDNYFYCWAQALCNLHSPSFDSYILHSGLELWFWGKV